MTVTKKQSFDTWFGTAAEKAAFASMALGDKYFATDTGLLYTYSGAAWVVDPEDVLVLAAGTALVGKFGIDQTTPGTTNKVVAELTGRLSSYIIPMFDLLAWSGFTSQPSNDGVEVVSNSASDTGKCTIFGTTNGTGAFAYETIDLTGTDAVATTKTDWGNIYGVFLGDIYGQNITPAVGTITVREASADQAITTIAATKISTGMVVFDLSNKDIDLNVHSGNAWVNSAAVVTTNNGLKLNLTGGNILPMRIGQYLYLISDTTGATAQIIVWA